MCSLHVPVGPHPSTRWPTDSCDRPYDSRDSLKLEAFASGRERTKWLPARCLPSKSFRREMLHCRFVCRDVHLVFCGSLPWGLSLVVCALTSWLAYRQARTARMALLLPSVLGGPFKRGPLFVQVGLWSFGNQAGEFWRLRMFLTLGSFKRRLHQRLTSYRRQR